MKSYVTLILCDLWRREDSPGFEILLEHDLAAIEIFQVSSSQKQQWPQWLFLGIEGLLLFCWRTWGSPVGWKKIHNLKTENYVLFSRQSRAWAQDAAFQTALRDCSEEVREKPEYIGVLQQRPGSQNIKMLLLVKENQVSQIKEFSAFLSYIWEDATVWAQWNHSFDWHFSYLGPVFCFSPSWVPSGCTPGGSDSGWELDGHSIHCLLIWQATLFIHKW